MTTDAIAQALAIFLGVVTVPTFVPQWLRAKRDTEGLSAKTWTAYATASAVWLVHGLRTADLALILVNGPTSIMLAWIAVLAIRGGGESSRSAVAYASVVAALSALSFLWTSDASGALGVAATVWMATPQVARVLRDPASATGVSLPTWQLGVFKQVVWTIYGVLDARFWVAVNGVVFGIMSLAIVVALMAKGPRTAKPSSQQG